MRRRMQQGIGLIAGFGLLLGVWNLAAWLLANTMLLPGPASMFAALVELGVDGRLWADIVASLKRVFFGFFLASWLAVPLALLLAYFTLARTILLPVVNFLRPIPPIAWIPLAILWFGIGDGSSFFITSVAAFFPIFINTFSGAAGAEQEHINAARCLGAGSRALLWRIYLPSALPAIWTGLRIGLGQAWMAVVTAELVTAQSGLGYLIQLSRLNLDTAAVIAGMCVIGTIGALMTALLGWAERYVIPWRNAPAGNPR